MITTPPVPKRLRRNAKVRDFLSLDWLEGDEEIAAVDQTDDDLFAPIRAAYRTEDGIIKYVNEVLGVADIAPYQKDILRAFVRERRVAVRAPHGVGKTALASWCVLWLMSVWDTDVKVVTTASAWRQLIHFLWPEVRKWANKAKWGKIGLDLRRGKEVLEQSIKFADKEAFPVASNDHAKIEGAHASVLAYVFDEAKTIPADIWDAAEGAFSTAGGDTSHVAFALAISTPGEPSGRFYDIHKRKRGYTDWWVRHVKLEEAIAAGRISREWANARKEQWGESAAVYRQRVLGEFDESGEMNVVPLAWVEAANERWHSIDFNKPEHIPGKRSGGVDPAYTGEDKTSIIDLLGSVVMSIETLSKKDTMFVAGKVASMFPKDVPVAIDKIGIGAGVFDRLKELHYQAIGVNVSESAKDSSGKPLTDKSGLQEFVNLRAFLWWLVREALDPDGDDPLALPPDDELTGDLTAPTWSYRSDGKILIESKDDLRLRLGRSTDKADALALALYARMKQRRLRIF